LTVPDRATLALGLVGHLATMMNRHQMEKLMDELAEEAQRVQDVPPSRQREDVARETREAQETSGEAIAASGRDDSRSDARNASARNADPHSGAATESRAANGRNDQAAHEGVGQAGRGEFRSGRLV